MSNRSGSSTHVIYPQSDKSTRNYRSRSTQVARGNENFKWVAKTKTDNKPQIGYSTIDKSYLVYTCTPMFMRIPLDALISDEPVALIDEPWLDFKYTDAFSICTTTLKLGPCIFLFRGSCCNEMYRCQLSQPTMQFHPCNPFPVPTCFFLSVQVGECFYVLSLTGRKETKKLVFQRYDIDNGSWFQFSDETNTIFNDCCSYLTDWLIYNICSVPHVVINHELHVSLGSGCSFSFDTITKSWEPSNLFQVLCSTYDLDGEPIPNLGVVVTLPTNQPFEFYKRGILLAHDILLGIQDSEEGQLVAFLLNGDYKAIKSQPIKVMDRPLLGAHLVVLGQKPYIGLLHLKYVDQGKDDEDDLCMVELQTYKFSKLETPTTDEFLQFDLVKVCLLGKKEFPLAMALCADAFCV